MSDESLQSSGKALAVFFAQYAQMAEAREAKLGHAVENCPTSADLWGLVGISQHLSALSDPVPVGEADALMRALAAVSDKWVDPASDAIGVQLHGNIESLIGDLQQLIGETLPDAAEPLQQWNSLRRLEQAMRRAVYLRKRIRPKFLSYLYGKWQDRLIARAFRKQP